MLFRSRAPLLSDGEVLVSIDPDAQVLGAREIGLEAWARWSTDDASTGALHFDGVLDPAGRFDAHGVEGDNADHRAFYQQTLRSFVDSPRFAVEERLSGVPHLVVRPGIELVNADTSVLGGDIRVLSDWNLGAGTRDKDGLLVLAYRHGGVAPVLTLRAAGDLRIGASLSDGFFQNRNQIGRAHV